MSDFEDVRSQDRLPHMMRKFRWLRSFWRAEAWRIWFGPVERHNLSIAALSRRSR